MEPCVVVQSVTLLKEILNVEILNPKSLLMVHMTDCMITYMV